VPRALSRGPETVINPEGRQSTAGYPVPDPLAGPASTIVRILFPPADEIPDESRLGAAIGAQLGHFTIVKRIRTGGMGAVFQALDTRLNRIVALKVLPPLPSRDPSAVLRFRKEAQAAAQLNHENIARVYYIGEDQGLHFIAFEFVHGTNLRDLITERGQLLVEDALNYTLQVASALGHTSAQGVVHRDIKPSNIIITPAGRAKLVDLGLARNEARTEGEPDLTVAGTTLGTFDYISPEQARDPRTADIRSDIYSLGCTLYHLLTAEPPYPQGTMLQKLLQHQGDEAPDPGLKNRRVPSPLSAIVRKMMAKDPRRRYQNPEQLIRDLMLLAGAMGLQSTSPEGLVWVSPQSPRPSFVERHIAWIVCVVGLLLAVGYLEIFGGRSGKGVNPDHDRREVRIGSGEIVSTGKNSTVGLGTVFTPPGELKKPEKVAATAGGTPTPNPGTATSPTANPPVSTPGNVLGLGPEPIEVTSLGPPEIRQDELLPESAASVPRDPDVKTVEPLPAISVLLPENPVRQSFPSVAAACADRSTIDGAVIELRFNGRREERPFRIARKLTIRAAPGFRPVLEFVPREIPAEQYPTRMITLTKGSLQLIGVELLMTVQEQIPAECWSLFLIQKAEALRLQSSIITLQNPKQRPAALCEIQGGTSPVMPEPGSGTPRPAPLEVEFNRTLCRSQGDLISLKSLDGVRITLQESLTAIDGALLLNLGNSDVASADARVELNLERSTLAFTRSLVRVDTGEFPRRVLAVQANVIHSLLSSSTPEPLVFMTGKTPSSDFRSLLNWKGLENQYDRLQNFWGTASTDSASRPETVDFPGWQRMSVTTGETSSRLEAAAWKQPWDGKPLGTLLPSDFELSNTNLEQPPDAATGAPLPQLPGYHTAKATRPGVPPPASTPVPSTETVRPKESPSPESE
jgi:serine/threonine-protein kinase